MRRCVVGVSAVLGTLPANADDRLAPAVAPAEPGAVYWHTYAAFRNDAFSDAAVPLDDWGFTHDNVFSLRRQEGDLAFGGTFMHRWLTANAPDYQRRWDQLELVALVEKYWPHRIVTTGRLGPTLGGNWGGRYLQNGWHAISGTGPTVDSGNLADDYQDTRGVGLVAGARGRGQLGGDPLHGYAILDAQAGLGGGVSWIESALGGSASWRYVGLHAEVAVTRYRASDPQLEISGGYGRGWQLEWRAGVHVAWSRFRVSYQFRANEGGSGEPIGVIAFQSRR